MEVKTGNIFEYYIKPNSITTGSIEINLSLNKPVTKTKSFYIYECGSEDNDPIAQYL